MQPGVTRLLSLWQTKKDERQHYSGLPDMQAAQLYHDKEQKDSAAKTGIEEVLSVLQTAHTSQRNQVIRAGQ